MQITSFQNKHSFLSNFYYPLVDYTVDGITYVSSEHAYQARKAIEPIDHIRIKNAPTPALAKAYAQDLFEQGKTRKNWFTVRVDVMRQCLAAKFKVGTDISQNLVNTYPLNLIEGNHWGDTFWGVYNGRGQNMLGRLLMERRQQLIFGLDTY